MEQAWPLSSFSCLCSAWKLFVFLY
uniref:Uncharacterized protein n=1 Tax=Rhizophora mucronata TaxID=61149 RepID=A0A2P2N0X5_RHIMU